MLLDVIEVNNEGTALVTPLVRGSDLQQRIFSDSGDKVWLLLLLLIPHLSSVMKKKKQYLYNSVRL